MSQREYFVYDGRNSIGTFTIDDDSGEARAFGAEGKAIGIFSDFKSAATANSALHRARRHSIPAPDRHAVLNQAPPAPAGAAHIVQNARGQP